MTEQQSTSPVETEAELEKASVHLGFALLASGKLLTTENLNVNRGSLSKDQKDYLKDVRDNEENYWKIAEANSGKYSSEVASLRQVMKAAVKIMRQSSIDSISFNAALFNSVFLGDPTSTGVSRGSELCLMPLLLARVYINLNPEKRKELLTNQGAEIRHLMGEEGKCMKQELGQVCSNAWPFLIAQSILTGGLKLPPQDQVTEILNK